MLGTLNNWLSMIGDTSVRRALRQSFGKVVDRNSSFALNTAGLTIKTAGSALAKTGAADCYLIVDGSLVLISAATDMPALTGLDITAAYYNVAQFFVDKAGTTQALFGTEGSSIGDIKFPQPPEKQALIGTLLITYASAFTGGTTPLDTATTVYINSTAPYDLTAVLG